MKLFAKIFGLRQKQNVGTVPQEVAKTNQLFIPKDLFIDENPPVMTETTIKPEAEQAPIKKTGKKLINFINIHLSDNYFVKKIIS